MPRTGKRARPPPHALIVGSPVEETGFVLPGLYVPMWKQFHGVLNITEKKESYKSRHLQKIVKTMCNTLVKTSDNQVTARWGAGSALDVM